MSAEGAAFLRILVFGFGLSYTFLVSFCAMLIASGVPLIAATITLALIPLEVLLQGLVIPSYGGVGAAAVATLALTLGAITAGFLYALVLILLGELTREDLRPFMLWRSPTGVEMLSSPQCLPET
jgi:O-antigen/teichoic acid export membrane protein